MFPLFTLNVGLFWRVRLCIMMVKSFKNWSFCMIMHTCKVDKVNIGFQNFCDTAGRNYLNKRFLTRWQYRSLTFPHLHLSRTLSKISWAPATTNYCKINPINIWQNSTIATGSLLISVTFNHIICQKSHACKVTTLILHLITLRWWAVVYSFPQPS